MHYRIITAASGLPTLEAENEGRRAFIHSKIDPLRESQVYADRYDPSRFDVLIVLGAGLGYHLLPIQNKLTDYRTIIVIDPIGGMEKEIALNEKTSFVATSEKIKLITGKTTEEVDAILPALIDLDAARGVAVVEHVASVKFHGTYFTAIRETIERAINISAGNMATVKAFGGRYLKNALINSGRLDGMIPLDLFKGAFRGFPVVLAAPGVSLEASIPSLKRYRQRVIVVAVDSVLSVLMGHGLDADFVVSIDPQPYINEHYLHASGSVALPVYSLTVHHGRTRRGPAVMALNSHPICQFLSDSGTLAIGSIESGTGTVAGDALSFCYHAGFGRIALAGLDFCFTDHCIYAKGTAYQRRYSTIYNSRLRTAERFNMEYIKKSSRDFSIGGISTRRSFVRYRDLTARMIEERPSNGAVTVQRLERGGLPLDGVPTVTSEEFFSTTGDIQAEKKSIMRNIMSGRRIDGRVVLKYMKNATGAPVFIELCRASLAREASEEEVRKYRSIVMNAR